MTDEQLRATSAWCGNCLAVRSIRYDPAPTESKYVLPFELVCTDCASIIATLYFDAPVTACIHNAWEGDDPTQTIVIDT